LLVLPPTEEVVTRPVPDDELPPSWRRVREQLRRAVSDATWHQWLAPLRLRELTATGLVLEAPEESRAWVADHFGRLLQACAGAVLGPEIAVEIVAAGALPPPVRPAAGARRGADAVNPRHTFDQFVIGDANRLAHAAALAVAELPGLAYNPLYICGPPGLGKTHLLHSIANYLAECGDTAVRYTTAEAFTNHFLAALHGRDTDAFKAAYRDVDVLLVDDVQFLEDKARTEQEFFHTFNELHQGGAQIVLTSDRPPRDMTALEDRLRERFEAGLLCDVAAPDRTTRLTILRKRVEQDEVDGVEPEALEAIADRVTDNVRALEGALIRTVAFGSLTGRPITAELAEEVLAGLYPEARPARPSVRAIQEQTAAAFGLSVEELLSGSRSGAVAWPRQVAMYLARELTDQTLPAIGKAFGGRNHTTVLHACKRTAEKMAADPEAYDAVRRLGEVLRGRGASA
jgi:chromosomal replication initiator protein